MKESGGGWRTLVRLSLRWLSRVRHYPLPRMLSGLRTGLLAILRGERQMPPGAQSPLRPRLIRPLRSGVRLSMAVVARTCGLACRPRRI